MKVVGRDTIYRVFKGSFHDWLRGLDFFRERKILDSSCKLSNSMDSTVIKDLFALNIISLNEFKAANKAVIKDFICNKKKVRLEIGQSLKSKTARDNDAPVYIKVNDDYCAVVSAKDVSELLN